MVNLDTLNQAQREAVLATDNSVLVIAGAGSGKTRTIVHRIAWLYEQGIDPSSILLLTFTRKAAVEMLNRAADLLGQSLHGLQGGTFHGFAYSLLRHTRPTWATGPITIMDSADCSTAISTCKESLKLGKGDRSFPKTNNILSIISKGRNKEMDISEVLRRDFTHLMVHEEALHKLSLAYLDFKRNHNLLDYDDLLFELDNLLATNADLKSYLHNRFQFIMVDEYQDTNKVQARLTSSFKGNDACIMAVGDDAQSIYAFRGADVRNILDFQNYFPQTRLVRLEENYRSTQQVLNVANAVLAGSKESFEKNLYTNKSDGELVRVVRPLSDSRQADIVTDRIDNLLQNYQHNEIAVLFRSGYHSYHLEMALAKRGIKFKKYGGLRYTEAAHIKDALAFLRLIVNPLDMPSLERVAALTKGIGPKTAHKFFELLRVGDREKLSKQGEKYPDFLQDLKIIDDLRTENTAPEQKLGVIIDNYRSRLELDYPDDWPRRLQGLEELRHIASAYNELEEFMSDLVLEAPENKEDGDDEHKIILSTIHSAKGLEWDVVLMIDMVEDRFPSRHALARPEDYEEERRLMYVACTRARERLELFVPQSIYNRATRNSEYVNESPFIQELSPSLYEEWQEGYGGQLQIKKRPALFVPSIVPQTANFEQSEYSSSINADSTKCGFCTHKIFGRGKVVEHIHPDKCRVNFSGIGLKVILSSYLTME